jgi:hypothetical protein
LGKNLPSFLPSFLPFFLLLCATANSYYAAEKEDFSDPSKIIAAIPADIHHTYCLDRSGNPVGFVLLTKDGIYDSHV